MFWVRPRHRGNSPQNAKINPRRPDGAQPRDEDGETYPRLSGRAYTGSNHRRADEIRRFLSPRAKAADCIRPTILLITGVAFHDRLHRLQNVVVLRRGQPNRAVRSPSGRGEPCGSGRNTRKRTGLEKSDFFRIARFAAAVPSAPQVGRRRAEPRGSAPIPAGRIVRFEPQSQQTCGSRKIGLFPNRAVRRPRAEPAVSRASVFCSGRRTASGGGATAIARVGRGCRVPAIG